MTEEAMFTPGPWRFRDAINVGRPDMINLAMIKASAALLRASPSSERKLEGGES